MSEVSKWNDYCVDLICQKYFGDIEPTMQERNALKMVIGKGYVTELDTYFESGRGEELLLQGVCPDRKELETFVQEMDMQCLLENRLPGTKIGTYEESKKNLSLSYLAYAFLDGQMPKEKRSIEQLKQLRAAIQTISTKYDMPRDLSERYVKGVLQNALSYPTTTEWIQITNNRNDIERYRDSRPSITYVIGLTNSGKDIFEKGLKKPDNVVLSFAKIQQELFPGVSCKPIQKEFIEKEVITRMRQAIEENKSIVWNGPNLTQKDRKAINQLAEESHYKKDACFVVRPYELCTQSTKKETEFEAKKEKDQIKHEREHFELPTPEEGFENYYIFHSKEEPVTSLTELMAQADTFQQNNPHHDNTLGEHMRTTEEYIKTHTANMSSQLAMKYHDIGKLYTEAKDESGVSHYLNHANVSAYEMLVHEQEILQEYPEINREQFIYAVQLANQHMSCFNREWDKGFSQEFKRDLELIHKADLSDSIPVIDKANELDEVVR